MTSTIPFAGFDRRYEGWVDDLVDVVHEVGESDEFVLASRVAALEAAIAAQVGITHAVGCASGTGALTLALTALGVGPGDEVVTPAFSAVSPAGTVALTGATPVFADVDLVDHALDPAAAATAITGRTRAIMAVHLFSQVAPMTRLRTLASRRGVALVEDSAGTLGGTVSGRRTGTAGDVGVFSFSPAKPLGGPGDAGMVVTADGELAATVRALRDHGQGTVPFRHDRVGFACHMDEIVAGFLLRRLPTLDRQLAARRQRAERYTAALPQEVAAPTGFGDRAVHTYVVRVPERDRLRRFLTANGVETVVHCPKPLHLQPAFAHLGHGPGDFPNAERLARECVALPLYPEQPLSDVDRVAELVTRFFRSGS
ncbi:DegT/DnrJ/EryC1/StrS family aminotransferase [Actinophytocola sp. NPDC049390]|uniref:DegT/DnrJ/EryC1/StrS family aminotransferase n=1 Tax=Actinophytocola sp. NPDC049390 TaxID=3363894 RepID=UPI0037B520C8